MVLRSKHMEHPSAWWDVCYMFLRVSPITLPARTPPPLSVLRCVYSSTVLTNTDPLKSSAGATTRQGPVNVLLSALMGDSDRENEPEEKKWSWKIIFVEVNCLLICCRLRRSVYCFINYNWLFLLRTGSANENRSWLILIFDQYHRYKPSIFTEALCGQPHSL